MTEQAEPAFEETPTLPQNSTLALVSLIAGVASWTVLPFFGAVIAVVTGHMAKKEIQASNMALQGDGFATAGLIMGYLNLAVGLCFCLLILAALLFLIPAVTIRTSLLMVGV
jgi:hypothetical protein